ncbi:uncharacterized protein LOC117327746 [Pecten maximus]|uniref:uncharacterized protein LOC117327746 n=1 Tax=Pecten maximus TaxID=6579 RepID=UPI0014588993|nr:uncharacterized protein LOC117327746 [Pecten maximus]XP_033740767.1 uncharacterized protein LOC117327746 [Pecten maximus]
MAVPAPYYNDAENCEIARKGDALSPVLSEDVCNVCCDSGIVKEHKSYKKRFDPRSMCSRCKRDMKKNKLRSHARNGKLLDHWPVRKKVESKEKRKTSSSKEERKKRKKLFSLKNFHCLRGDKTEVNSHPDKIEQDSGIYLSGKTCQGDTSDVSVTCQNGLGNVLPLEGELSDAHQFSWNDSFRDIHVFSLDMDLSSLQYQSDVIVNAIVSRTVEADGISYGTTYECDEDDKCEDTMVKEVVTACKQSARIQPDLTSFERSSSDLQPCGLEFHVPVQCTEVVEDYTPRPVAITESQLSGNSSESYSKDDYVENTKPSPPDFRQICHTEPFVCVTESCSQLMSTDYKVVESKIVKWIDATESLSQPEIKDMKRDNFEEKLKGCPFTKTGTEEDRHCDKPFINGSSDEKVQSKSKMLMGGKLPSCSSPDWFQRTPSCYTCSRCEFSTTGSALSEGELLSSTSLSRKRSCGQAKMSSVFLVDQYTFSFRVFLAELCKCTFLFFLISLWLDFEKKQKVHEGEHKNVFTLLQSRTDTESGKSPKQNKTNDDRKPKDCNLFGNSKLANNELTTAGDWNSSDVVEPLHVYVPSVDQSNPAVYTANENISQPNSTEFLNVHQQELRHTRSDQMSSLQRKSRLVQRKKHARHLCCKRHAIKHEYTCIHIPKSRTSRRLVKRMNSLENFVFQRSKVVKNSKHDTGRRDYLHSMLNVRSDLNVFMLPFNHPNSQPANGTDEAGHGNRDGELGASAGRLSSLETPPSTVNGHIGVFEQISTGTVTESMKFEWARFKSFWSFPMSCPIPPTVLAKYGFYYTGNEDKVCCFCCGVTHGNWQKGQSVYAMHYQISRRCRFMLGEDVGNVPIHGPYSSLNRRGGGQEASLTTEPSELTPQLQTPDSVTSILLGREGDSGNQVTTSLLQALPTVPDLRNETRNGLGVGSGQNSNETRNGLGVGSGQNRNETRNGLGVGSGQNSTAARNGLGVGSGQNRNETRNGLGVGSGQNSTEARNDFGAGSAQNRNEMRNGLVVSSAQNHTEIRNGLESASNLPTPQTSSASSSSVSQSPQPVSQVSTLGQTPAQPGHAAAHQQASAPNTSTVSQTVASPQNQIATQSRMDTMANQQRPANQQHPTTLAQRHQEQRQIPAAANNHGNLGIITARPRYPNYAVLTVRSSTFNGFPNHLDQTPLQMAQAGFFYAGYGDYVRCFFCGGGLRNWEPGDDPWVEHARWFPRCAYVKQNKGQTFINMVLQRQRELTLPNEYIRTTSGASSTTSSATTQTARIMDNQTGSVREPPPVSVPTTTSTANTETPQTGPTTAQRQTEIQLTVTAEEMESPAVLSIREMGYNDEMIKTAIQQLRRNQGPVPLSAEVLVEIIFGFGDDLPLQRPDQTQTTGPNSVPTTQTETPPSNENPSLANRTPEPQMGAALHDPRPPRRPRDGDSSTRAYTEEELKSIEEENNQLKEQMKCKICMDNIVCISFLPCGHLCCCAECAPAMVKCPICRQIIRGSVKTYLS